LIFRPSRCSGSPARRRPPGPELVLGWSGYTRSLLYSRLREVERRLGCQVVVAMANLSQSAADSYTLGGCDGPGAFPIDLK